VRRALKDNSLSIVFGVLFLVAVAAQSLAGWHVTRDEAAQHGEQAPGYLSYLTSSDFGQALLENWQSEYLQFTLFILLTIWLMQIGSPESKELGKEGLETDEEQKLGPHAPPDAPRWAMVGDWRRQLYSWSLLIVMATLFFLSWLGQSLTGWRQYNEEQAMHGASAVSWPDFLVSPQFWEQTLQNWQSEFLAVGSLAIFAVFLRQRGSSESKPVGEPHDTTGVSG
jgi:hypothetical protein